jgi:hypothetical protein
MTLSFSTGRLAINTITGLIVTVMHPPLPFNRFKVLHAEITSVSPTG